jgi:tRNA A-37 threonylcarbamoyl transferase component Bud32
MFVVAPIRRGDASPIAALACRMDPRQEFAEMLSESRFGETGEIYAFNRDGYMISRSRFESELKGLGLIPGTADSTSMLQLKLLDPGVDLHSGRPASSRDSWPLTRMAMSATQTRSGVDVQGYRDYRGVSVAGAWTWIDDYDFGLAAEMDLEEIQQPFVILRRASLMIFALLGLSALGLAGFTAAVNRLQQQLRRAALEARRLGQYAIEEEIGHGFNGRVFRARHARLRRPVAVKLLDTDRTNPSTIARFEREVQATCGLTHPNTIVVYDYGRTPEDIFYYAMEYLDGLPLNTLVERFGPQPDGRTIWILRQACGSLTEAHQRGLIHRDIKPANLFLTRRGELADFVKVLDFGLVKAVDPNTDLARTVAESLIGSPHFLSPEGINNPNQVDPRSDLYSLGAVGYFLLTGQPVFEAGDLTEVLLGHSHTTPIKPSERRGRSIDPALEQLILQCLEKNPGLRPSNAHTLEQALLRCPAAAQWSQANADEWWMKNLQSEHRTSHVDR